MELNKENLRRFVMEGVGDVERIFKHDEDQTTTELVEDFKNVCNSLNQKHVANFIATKLLPALLLRLDDTMKNNLLSVASSLIEDYPIRLLSAPEIKKFKKQIIDSYVSQIDANRKAGDETWSKVWMLFIRYLQEHLHKDVDVANSLFRIVEAGFRSVLDRMSSYDCWKELIRNYQINEVLIKSSRHIRLLVTPLKVKLSGNELLVYKRFEVWVFLLKALKENAFEVLDAFLRFCFGDNEEQPIPGKPGIHGLGKTCSLVWREATEVLLEIMGHRALCDGTNCWKNGAENRHEFDAPIVTAKNFQNCYSLIIYTVIECTLLLEKWADDSTQKQVTFCLWSTLFMLNKKLSSEAVVAANKQIYDFLTSCAVRATKQEQLQKNIILSVSEINSTHIYLIIKDILVGKEDVCIDLVPTLLKICSETKEQLKFFKLAGHIFTDLDLKWKEVSFLRVWLLYYEFFRTANHLLFLPAEAAAYLISYVLNMDVTLSYQRLHKRMWCELFNKFSTTKTNFENVYTTEVARILNHDESYRKKEISMFYLMIDASGRNVENYDFSIVNKCWDVLHSTLDATQNFVALKEITVMMQSLLVLDLKKFYEQEQVKLIPKIGYCILICLTKHKIYAILDQIEIFVKKLRFPLKITIAHLIEDKILELCSGPEEISAKAIKICKRMSSKKRVEHPTIDLSRGAKLTNMARNSLDTLLNNNQKKNNQLNKSSPTVEKKKEFPEIFGKTEEYAVIDTEVKFDKAKLSARQKDNLKRRRDDIPSLYSDLTQETQSESLSESLSNLDVQKESTSETNGVTEDKCLTTKESPVVVNEKAHEANDTAKTKKHVIKKESPVKANETIDDKEKRNTSRRKSSDTNDSKGKKKKISSTAANETSDGNEKSSVIKNESPLVSSEKSGEANGKRERKYLTRRSLSLDAGEKPKRQKQKQNTNEETKIDETIQECCTSGGTVNENDSEETDTKACIVEGGNNDSYDDDEVNVLLVNEAGAQDKEETADMLLDAKSQKEKKNIWKKKNLTAEDMERRRQVTLKRELQRLKIDSQSKVETTVPVASNTRRSIRYDNKIKNKSKPPSPSNVQKTAINNNNTEVIESSQESIVDIKPLCDSVSKETKEDTEMETESCNADTNIENQNEVENNDLPNKTQTFTETEIADSKKDTESCDPYEAVSISIEVQIETPKKPIINDSDLTAVVKDTDSLSPTGEDLPGSPVTVETPTRTSELILNTSDISPIRLNEKSEKPALKQKTLEDYVHQQSNNRSAKLLSLVSNAPNLEHGSETLTDSVPVTVLACSSSENIVNDAKERTREPDVFLTFSRELPSSSAVPVGGSILKRKKPDFTEDISPCVKRKRVNFPDPPTTSEKLISIESDETKPILKVVKRCRKQLDMNDVKSTVLDVNMKNETETDNDNLDVGTSNTALDSNSIPAATEISEGNLQIVISDSNDEPPPEVVIKTSTDRLIDAIHKLDKDKEEHVAVMRETFTRIEAAMPRPILAEMVYNLLKSSQ